MAFLGQLACDGETGGACADNGDLFSRVFRIAGTRTSPGRFEISGKALEAADGDGLAFLAEDALRFALRLLRADPSADGGQAIGFFYDMDGAHEIAFLDFLYKVGDLDIYGAAFDAGRILAVKAPGRFTHCIFFRVAKGDFVEVLDPELRVLLGHFPAFSPS